MRRARRSDRLRVTGARVASLPSNGKLLLPESVSTGARASGAKAGLLFFCAEFGRVDLAESRVRADDGCDDVLKKKPAEMSICSTTITKHYEHKLHVLNYA